MTKLVDLKRTKAEKKADSNPSTYEGNDYPYGLTVELDHDALQKLGIDKMPKAGDTMHVQAHAHVKSVEERQHSGGKKSRRMSLELRKMAIAATQRAANEGEVHEGKLDGALAAMDQALDKKEGKEPKGKT
ncbi:MAG: hypothetical protein KGL39_09495 [Patescibacteria group bacterium]|nr:hypothetical protein [Patescibacteria group bacterium]